MNSVRIFLVLGCALMAAACNRQKLPEGALIANTPGGHTKANPDNSIPEHLWGPEIAKLKPIRVYRHRVNIAVVLSEDAREERGIYFQVLESSYLPVDGPGMRYHWNAVSGYKEYVFTK